VSLGVVVTGTPIEGDTLTAEIVDTSITPPAPPAASRFFEGYRWRFLFTDLNCVTTTWADGLLTSRTISKTLGQPTTIEAQVVSDDPRVNTIFSDGYPLVAQSNRLCFAFRREGGTPPWVCRAAGILMSPEDQGTTDIATTHFTAYDPRQLLAARPCMTADGTLPGSPGLRFFDTTGDQIVTTLLERTIANEGGCFIDAGVAHGGTLFWGGTIETTDPIDFTIQQGTMVGEAWSTLEQTGNLDIVLTPIYDPLRRPGYTHELSVYRLAGTERYGAIFGWDRLNRAVAQIERMHDGTPGSFFNKVQYYAGQGGPPVPLTGPLVNTESVAAFGSYWAQQFFPALTDTDPTGAAVLALAAQALVLAKQGKRTLTITPTPERAPVPFLAYDVGDRVPVYASSRLRVTADGLQRVQGMPIQIADDDIERIGGLLCSPDWQAAA
jgi:hypothetical protein